ncbi:hypothetical protein BHQ23_30810 [Mycobacterium gordonae]|nr:hypothetical protein BHQ23_30810 [Mycobacterium gordonae]
MMPASEARTVTAAPAVAAATAAMGPRELQTRRQARARAAVTGDWVETAETAARRAAAAREDRQRHAVVVALAGQPQNRRRVSRRVAD